MKSVLREKSYTFAIEVVGLTKLLQKEKHEYVMSKQLLRSGTAIGAQIAEAEFGQSRSDFIHKLSISLKEANETFYWLSLLKDTDYIGYSSHMKLSGLCSELIKILIASINTSKNNRK